MAALKTHYCGHVFFLQRPLFLVTDSKFQSLPTLSSHNSCSKPPNLKNYHIFRILRMSIGKAADINIVRSAASWKFSWEYHEKMQKNNFFCFRANYSRFWCCTTYPEYHHVKAGVLRILKMYEIRGLRGFEQELWLLKVRRLWNFGSVYAKLWGVMKTNTRPQ